MKQIRSNGKELEVRDISKPIYKAEIADQKYPLPIMDGIFSEDQARNILEKIKSNPNYRCYDPTKIKN